MKTDPTAAFGIPLTADQFGLTTGRHMRGVIGIEITVRGAWVRTRQAPAALSGSATRNVTAHMSIWRQGLGVLVTMDARGHDGAEAVALLEEKGALLVGSSRTIRDMLFPAAGEMSEGSET